MSDLHRFYSFWDAMEGSWKNLPAGHYGKIDAQKVIDAEYSLAHEVEKEWCKKFGRKWPKIKSTNEALTLINNIAYSLGEKKPIVKKIVLSSPDIRGVANAHYNIRGREIHFRTMWISFDTLLHEGAHFYSSDHGENFCLVLNLLFEAAYERVS